VPMPPCRHPGSRRPADLARADRQVIRCRGTSTTGRGEPADDRRHHHRHRPPSDHQSAPVHGVDDGEDVTAGTVSPGLTSHWTTVPWSMPAPSAGIAKVTIQFTERRGRDVGHQADPFGRLRDGPEGHPGVGGMAHLVEPREVVVAAHRKVEAGSLGRDSIRNRLCGTGLLSHQGVSDSNYASCGARAGVRPNAGVDGYVSSADGPGTHPPGEYRRVIEELTSDAQ
jgi:hypothetical protein